MNKKFSVAAAALWAVIALGCLSESDSGPGSKPQGKVGEARISITVAKVGALHKSSVLELEKLHLTLSASGQDTIRDSFPLSGYQQQTHNATYPGLASLITWTLEAKTVDQNGETLHTGSTTFILPPGATESVSLTLAAQYSMLKARFFPIRDSVTTLQLRVDGDLVDSSVFAKQSRLGDTVVLNHDYLAASPAGTVHAIRLDARGSMWGFDTLLYRGDTTITVISGKDTSYKLTLYWVGPSTPPPGEATMSVTLGALGTILVDGKLENTTPSWHNVGTAGFSAGPARFPSLVLDASGTPYVAFQDLANGQKTAVMKLNGNTTWAHVGAPGLSPGESQSISLALDANGKPHVAFQDWTSYGEAIVMKWSGTVWQSVGTPGFTGEAFSTSLALDASGNPFIAFEDESKGYTASVMKWNGTAWAYVGIPAFSPGKIAEISLALDATGNPYVAFQDIANGYTITVMKWNGTTWTYVGTPAFLGTGASEISIALDASGNPYVAFKHGAEEGKAAVMKWNGTAWESVGTPGVSPGGATSISFALDGSGNPHIAFRDEANGNKLTVMKWSGTAWDYVGTPGASPGTAEHTSLALDVNGTPYVAFKDGAKSGKATVMRFAPVP